LSEHVAGFLNINKPSGMTSHDVVARVRRAARQSGFTRKVGHAGTLDPMATGVLVVCLGQATRLSEYVMDSTKVYTARVVLGVETDSYDADGTEVSRQDASHITLDQIESVLPQFVGTIQQLPPMYSAIKKDGKRLYELARAGVEIELQPRTVTIHALEILEWTCPYLTVRVTCAAGTYIRSLAHDLGAVLQTGAHLDRLERSASGVFDVQAGIPLEALDDQPDWNMLLIPPVVALKEYPAMVVSPEDAGEIMQGRTIPNADGVLVPLQFAYLADGWLLAVLENHGSYWKPHKVFLPLT
jgi:tRNA pseudouridine55 synthase